MDANVYEEQNLHRCICSCTRLLLAVFWSAAHNNKASVLPWLRIDIDCLQLVIVSQTSTGKHRSVSTSLLSCQWHTLLGNDIHCQQPVKPPLDQQDIGKHKCMTHITRRWYSLPRACQVSSRLAGQQHRQAQVYDTHCRHCSSLPNFSHATKSIA